MMDTAKHCFSFCNVGMRTQELVITFLVLGCALMRVSMSATIVDVYYPKHVHSQCNLTRYPNLCVETLMGLGSGNQNVDIIVALVNKTIHETNLSTSYFAELKTQDAQQANYVADYCDELMGMSLKNLDQSLKALMKSPRRNKNDIQTWLSASITFQQTCKDYANDHHHHHHLKERMSKKMDYLSQLVSNSLALVNKMNITNIPKSKTTTSNEKEKEFLKWVSAKGRKVLQGDSIKANAIVAQDGSGDYKTISEAIEAAKGTGFVIYVKKGVYKEKIRTNKDGITLIGDGKNSTLIVGDDSVAKGTSMPDTATFSITGNGFIARDIGFENNAGPQGQQALALSVASDRAVLYRCRIAGYQDTLYAISSRQFYRECDIYGTIDFIFGDASAVFQSCNLVLRAPYGSSYDVILAHGRTAPEQNSGFSLHKCAITTSPDYTSEKSFNSSYLGRPWKEYSRSVVMETTLDGAIVDKGWVEWPGSGESELSTLYFAEYANEGPGAGLSQRVKWPGFHVLEAQEADKFTVASFIAGTSWIPSTGVTFISGLN